MICISIMIVNILNSHISSFLINQKKNTNLQLRNNHSSMCSALTNFNIKNVEGIFVGDSHLYSSLMLEQINKEFKNLYLACAIPTISFKNLINVADKINKKYDPKVLIVSLSAFQFMLGDEAKEKERMYYYNSYASSKNYSFKFDIIKQYILNYLKPFSEVDLATQQSIYLKSINGNYIKDLNEKKLDKINKMIIKRYNSYVMDQEINLVDINDTCTKFNNIKKKLIFIDIPIPNFFKESLTHNKIYQKNINELSKCFIVLKSDDIKVLSNDIFYYDRGGDFLNKKNLTFDVSHMNFAGSLIYTKYLVKVLKNYNLK